MFARFGLKVCWQASCCIIVGLLGVFAQAHATPVSAIDFEVVKKEASSSPTLLLLGGIQGDEPGGFNATNIFLNHYTLKRGSVWVVPVLNPHSMLRNHRGIYDDMNRKFAKLDPKDPEAPLIEHVKTLIRDERVQVVLHLHDGSGFYRPSFESKLANPNRWGNCTVIDQDVLEGVKFGELKEIGTYITEHINSHLLAPIHRYHLHNTETEQKDLEMQKALTFYAINQGKPGYANEASKELGVAQRVYYHLLAIEALLTKIGIEYERDFELTPQNVQNAIKDHSQTFAIESLPELPLFGLRPLLGNFPIPKGKQAHEIAIHSSNKILGFLPRKDEYGNPQLALKYGNNVMTKITPKYIQPYEGNSAALESIQANIDGEQRNISVGERVRVDREITLPRQIALDDSSHALIKVIGLMGNPSHITKSSLNPSASLDKAGKLYRAEIYIRQSQPQESKAESSGDFNLDSAPQPSTPESSQNSETTGNPSSVRVQVNLANIRAKPSVDSAIAGMVGRDMELEVLDRVQVSQGEWIKVRYIYKGAQISGYILANLTKAASSATSLARVQVNLANIRAKPSVDSAIVAKAPRGRIMEVLATELIESSPDSTPQPSTLDSSQAPTQALPQKWAQIHYVYGAKGAERDIKGWILARLLTPLDRHSSAQSTPVSSPKPSPKPPKYKEYFGGMIVLEFAQ